MNKRNLRAWLDATTEKDQTYVAKQAGIGRFYLVYHVVTGKKVVTEETARLLELSSRALTKRKPNIPWLRCTDFIDTFVRCPHDV